MFRASSPPRHLLVDEATNSILMAFTTAPTRARALLIDDLVLGLKADGIWTLLDELWILAAADEQASCVNWKHPGVRNLSLVDAPTFTMDRGWQGDGVDDALTAGLILSTMAVNFTLNAASFGLWSRTDGQSSVEAMGGINQLVRLRNTSDQLVVRVNSGTSDTVANTNATGFFELVRTDASTVKVYRNGSQIGSDISRAAASVTSTQQRLLSANLGGSFSTREVAAAFYGGALDATQAGNFYTRLQTYMTAVGA